MFDNDNNDNNDFGHALPEALFPLFKSDLEYNLINSVLSERFDEKKKILVMYKYLASRNLPKFVLFSEQLPYGIVVKRLPPEKAWNEVFANKILSKIHNYDFDVFYHESLGCISEKYLLGYDLLNLPKTFLDDEKIISRIFYWTGKCACVAYIFGLGDRGHNERIYCKNKEDIYQFYSLTRDSEPIINIDYEEFPSKRLFNIPIDIDEIALVFYSVVIQLPDKYFNFYENWLSYFQNGFKDKFKNIKKAWQENQFFFITTLENLFSLAPRKYSKKMESNIKNRVNSISFEKIFDNIGVVIDAAIKKFKIFKLKEREKALLREKRRMVHYHKEDRF